MNDDEKLMQQALEALEESIDLVQHDYTTDWRHGMPTRQGQLDASLKALVAHRDAIAALRDRLARPVVPQAEPVAREVTPQEDAVLRSAARRSARLIHPAAPAPVPLTDERLRFEEWLHSQHIDVPRLCDAGSYRAGEYESTDIEDWWAAWQARAAHGIGGER